MHHRNIRKLACALVIAALAAAPVFAGPKEKKVDIDPYNWALGVFLGEPTGVTVQFDIAKTQALEFKAAWNFSNSGSVALQGNYVLWFPGLFVFDGVDIPPFVGGGVDVRISSDPVFGLRVPFGVRYRFREAPIELALELGVGLALFPATDFMASGGLAVRWMF